MSRFIRVVSIGLFLLVASVASAETAGAPNRAIDYGFLYRFEYNETLAGGLNRGAKTLGNFDARVTLDLEKLTGMKGLSAFFYGLGNHGGDPSENIGDAQVTSNIESPTDTFRLYEAWLQQLFFDGRVSVLAGLHDLNSEFYSTESSALFFNSSFGVGKELAQTGKNGPSIFPVTAPALRLRVDPTESFYLQTALFNAVAGHPDLPYGTHVRLAPDDGLLVITEAAILRGKGKGASYLSAKYAIGYWQYTKPSDDLNARVIEDGSMIPKPNVNSGAYLLLDQAFTDRSSAFLRVGVANAEVNEVAINYSFGLSYLGLIPSRSDDKIGLGMTRAVFGDPYRRSQAAQGAEVGDYETVFELNYRCEIAKGFAFQPDYQYVVSPSGSPSVPFASVFAARIELGF